MNTNTELQNLLDQIIPLHSEKIRIGTKLTFDKENYLKTFDETKKQEIIDGQESLNKLEAELEPLRFALRNLQTKYLLQYQGIISDPINDTEYWQTYVEELNFKSDCNIDTFINGWNNYSSIPNSSNLLLEIHHFLLMHRFSKFTIMNIKKLP